MKEIPKKVTFLLIAVSILVSIVLFAINNYFQDNQVLDIHEILNNSVIGSRDDSARIDQGLFLLDEKSFENNFTELIKETSYYKDRVFIIDFEYLRERETTGIKAIRVYIIENDKVQEATVVLSKVEGS